MRGLALGLGAVLLRPVLWTLVGTLVLMPFLFSGRGDLGFYSDIAERPAGVVTTDPLERVAIVALFRAGFIRQMPMTRYTEDGEIDPDSKPTLEWATSDYTDQCTLTDRTRAILAAEGYARPAWRRDLEIAVAGVVQAVSGRLPDYSTGLGQVRLSTAEAALARLDRAAQDQLGLRLTLPADRDAVHRLLLDACGNQQMTEIIVAGLTLDHRAVQDLAAAYRGGRSWPLLPGVLSYETLVETMETVILPAARDTLNFGQFTLAEPVDPPAATISDHDGAETGLQPLICVSTGFIELYRPATLALTEPEGAATVLTAEQLARVVQAFDPATASATIVPPRDEDASDRPLRPPLAEAATAAVVLAQMNRLGLDRLAQRTIVTDPAEIARIREAAPSCMGWLVMGDTAAPRWLRALAAR